jgi:hypothetical protein
VVDLFLSAAPFSSVVPDVTGVELFFVARTASGSAQVRASARHCHRENWKTWERRGVDLDYCFGGMYSKDLLPQDLKRTKFDIVNMQDHDEGNGTHWVVFYYNKPNFNIF